MIIKEYFAPDGAKIVGVMQTVRAVAMIEGIDSMLGDPIYTGDSEILWDTMREVSRNRQLIYIDALNRRWSLVDLRGADGLPAVRFRARVRDRSSRAHRPADADQAPSAASSEVASTS